MPAMRPATTFSRRLRRCFLERGPFPLAEVRGRPLPAAPPAREGPEGPLRDAVVRARPPAGGRPARSRAPPPPGGRDRDGGGRRADPARGGPGEVSSWNGTREPLSDFSVRRRGRAPVAALGDEPGVFRCESGGGPASPRHGCGWCAQRDGPVRPITRWPPGVACGGAAARERV